MAAPLTYRAHARALLALGLPLIGGQVAQFAIGATDTLMLGWYGVESLAAGVLGGSFFFVFLLMGAGFSWAVLPLVAAATETDEAETQIRRITRMGIWLSLIYGACVLPVMLLAEPILLAIGQDPAVADGAGRYLRIAGFGIFPGLMIFLLRSYLSALERTRVVLWVTLVMVAVNAALNWMLIFGNWGAPELGIEGSAIATVAVQLVGAGLLALYATRVFPSHQLFVRLWRPDWEAFGRVFALGWPIGLTNLAEVGLFSFSAVMVGWLGTVPLGAHGIALQLASATFMFHLGLSNAATIRAGKAMGRHDREDLRRGGVVAVVLSVGFSVLAVAIFLAIPETLLGVFLTADDPDKPEILAVGVTLMVMAALFQMVDGLQVIALGLLRGVQDTEVPMVFAAISYWGVGLPAGYLGGFVLGWGAAGIWIGLVTGLAVAAVLLMHRFWTRGLGMVSEAAGHPARAPSSGV